VFVPGKKSIFALTPRPDDEEPAQHQYDAAAAGDDDDDSEVEEDVSELSVILWQWRGWIAWTVMHTADMLGSLLFWGRLGKLYQAIINTLTPTVAIWSMLCQTGLSLHS